eukprot:GFUD01034190.1.p1 GENE.GFUD01034190.1~~GFUD01034190.1.p1  ORF type:complete len:1065 (+),score=194.32 GFUD01034190.1:162-3356(+)
MLGILIKLLQLLCSDKTMKQSHRNLPPGIRRGVFGTKPSFGQMFSIITLILLNSSESKALESEQCMDMGGKLSTISFKTQLHEMPADFWSEGVDKSKVILETILKKIKSYEQNSDTKWIDVLRENFALGKGIVEINEGEIWTDDETGMSIKMEKGAFCAVVDSFKSPATELAYTCEESEQLYGIGYHKVYESCKNDPFLSKFTVDWGVCLHAHYPWVDMLHSNICVMKSYNNDFIACFCSMENGVLRKRGFCITKFECLLNGQGVERNRIQELEVREDCIHHIQYFLEANTNDHTWFKNALKKDNLRVRAPYHPDSPCRDQKFSSLFDIGQLDVDNIEAGIEVHTPSFEDISMDNDLREEEEEHPDDNMSCMPDIDPAHKVKMDLLSFFFEERMIANLVIWIPGILFVYSSIFEERGLAMRISVGVIQLVISSIGIYNMAISFLPDAFYSSIPDVRQIQIGVFGSVVLVTQVFFNFKEVTEHFLTVSILNFIPDIVFWKMIMVMYTEHRLGNFKIIIGVYFILVMIYTLYKLGKILSIMIKNRSIKNTPGQDDVKRSNSKKKREKPKNPRLSIEENNQSKTNQEKKRTKVKNLTEEIFPIVCQWKCTNVLNIGYISINCSEKCYNQYHRQCWDYYMGFNCLKNEKNLLGMNCLTSTCSGKIYEIVWVDKFGIETPKKFILTELEKIRVGNRKKVKTKKTAKIVRSLSETSGSSIEDKHSPKIIHAVQERAISEKINIPNQKDEKIKIPSETMTIIRTYSKSYASTVRNNNTLDNSKALEQKLTQANKQTQLHNVVDSLHNSDLVDELLGQNCPESFDPSCKLPQKSKILSLIRENSQSDYSFEGSVGEIGDKIETENFLKSKADISPPSGFIFDNGNKINAQIKTSKSLIFVPGTNQSLSVRNEVEIHIPEETFGQERLCKKDLNENIGFNDKPVRMDIAEVSPLSKILAKQVAGYSLPEIDSAVKDILHDFKLEDLTIPIFRNILIEKLENRNPWADGVYMSDDDEERSNDVSDVEECLICTELLEQELQHLEPCGHVFHVSCIRKWVQKESSCPKCRADVQL